MLRLNDFFHLEQIDPLVAQLVGDGPGLIVVAGLDPRPAMGQALGSEFMPSGRSTMFRILMREFLEAHPSARSTVVARDKDAVRIPRGMRSRVGFSLVQPPYTYAQQIASALYGSPDLLVIDHLSGETVPLALEAAQKGIRVLSQLDTFFKGADVARHLFDLGATDDTLAGLTWVVAVQRLALLCTVCKQPVVPNAAQLTMLHRHYSGLDSLIPSESDGASPTMFFQAGSCAQCNSTGRRGDVMVFDVFQAGDGGSIQRSSLLPMDEYVLRLAVLGHLALEDALGFDADQQRRTYNLLLASEQALAQSNATLERKLVELEAANRVLQQRTEALVSLQDIGQTLIASTGPADLAHRICQRARELCGADRAILYNFREEGRAEILAASGWESVPMGQSLDMDLLLYAATSTGPVPFNDPPPGVAPPGPNTPPLRAGLSVPLFVQDERVGVIIFHSTGKTRFMPGEVALLETYANQAAVAMQRTRLIEQLRLKIAQLEAAQAELAQKERMEHELELARQVQRSVLPHTFPQVPGFEFMARYEPARQVGGDFYDVIALDSDYFGIAIADVSGKGMPAALYMALARSLLLAEARRDLSPRAVLANVNDLLLEVGDPQLFVTMFYGIVETSARRLTYARAGHDRPLLLRGQRLRELGGTGVLLGLLDTPLLQLSEEQMALSPGDRLVLYTDGLKDVIDPAGRLFDYDRLKTLLRQYGGLPPAELCSSVFEDLAVFRGAADQFDDMAMLVVSVED
jgi:serine phosphatase RsbU (regulator of sigma subunit)